MPTQCRVFLLPPANTGFPANHGYSKRKWLPHQFQIVQICVRSGLFWQRYAAFFLLHATDDTALANWYEEEQQRIRQIRETPKQDESLNYSYDFSVVVLFYGNQKMTKDCLDAIDTYTKGHSYELITFDNGSDPETTAWCESLPHIKKIYARAVSSVACSKKNAA